MLGLRGIYDERESPLRVAVEGDELVIRIGVNRLDGHDTHEKIPTLEFQDRDKWVSDIVYQLLNEDESGATPFGNLLDFCMQEAIGEGSRGLVFGGIDHIGECSKCGECQVPCSDAYGNVCRKCLDGIKSAALKDLFTE